MRVNIIFHTGSQLKCWSQYTLNGGNSGQTVVHVICSLITISLFGIIFADSTVTGLKARLLIILSIARGMRLGVHYFELKHR